MNTKAQKNDRVARAHRRACNKHKDEKTNPGRATWHVSLPKASSSTAAKQTRPTDRLNPLEGIATVGGEPSATKLPEEPPRWPRKVRAWRSEACELASKTEREAIVAYLRSAKYRSDRPWSEDLDKIADEIEKEAHSEKRGRPEYFPPEDASYRVQIQKCQKKVTQAGIIFLVVTCHILTSTSSVPLGVRRVALIRLVETNGDSNEMGWDTAIELASAAFAKPTTAFDPPDLEGRIVMLQTKVVLTRLRGDKYTTFHWFPCEEP